MLRSPHIAAILGLLSLASVHGADGAEVFTSHCAPCHGADGKARTPAGKKLGAKDLSESKLPDAAIAQQILEGVKDARVHERMPAFKTKVTADDVAALVAHVKAFRR